MGDTKSLLIPYLPVDGSSSAKTRYSKRVFTLSEKAALINCSETERLSVKELTERFKCGKTAVYDILKRKSEILEQCLLGAGSRKRKFRKTGNEEVNKAVWQWFVEAKSNNFNVTGPLLQAQAKLAAEHLGKTDFKASNGWLDSFRTRHSISFKQRSAEATQVCPVTHTEWDEYCEK
jgi:transposase